MGQDMFTEMLIRIEFRISKCTNHLPSFDPGLKRAITLRFLATWIINAACWLILEEYQMHQCVPTEV